MKFKEYITIKGYITCLTGLRVGGTKDTVGIGETDNPIIRHPITRLPYIPGSSFKGKLRSLVEVKPIYGTKTPETGKPCDCGGCNICNLFGHSNVRAGQHPSRLIFRDAVLVEDSEKELKEALPGSYVEVKTEIAMNRNTGSAQQGALRQQERVPEGTQFDFEMVLRLYEEDNNLRKKYFELLSDGFQMLENDYLGGSGTRGYGKIEINENATNKPMWEYFADLAAKTE